VETVEKLISKY